MPTTRRKKFSYSAALDRILSDAEEGRYPIERRFRDCERISLPVQRLNDLHQKGDVQGLRDFMAGLVKAAAAAEEEDWAVILLLYLSLKLWVRYYLP